MHFLSLFESEDFSGIAAEMLPILGVSLPMPAFKVVNQLRADWLGRCTWRYGKKVNEEWCDSNTSIEVQRSIIEHSETLHKIIAHELCHHADNLVNMLPEFRKMGYSTFRIYNRMHNGHGPDWQKFASLMNAHYGPNFVTATSDKTYVIKPEIKEYFILLHRWPDGKLYYQAALRLSPKALSYLNHLKQSKDTSAYRMAKANDPQFLHGAVIRHLNGWSRGRDQAALETLWAKGEPLVST